MTWGSSIYARVTAQNRVGYSVVSTLGNGAIISTKPDAPTNLVSISAINNAQQIGLSWIEGTFNGGSVVIDYQIRYRDNTTTVYQTVVGVVGT